MYDWLGVDTGGTFTDFMLWRDGVVVTHKVLSTPGAPEQAILRGIADLGLGRAVSEGKLVVVHGTTVATNAALEGKGVRTLFITNEGLEDLLRLRRQTRANLYDLTPVAADDPAAQSAALGVPCRLDAGGREVTPLSAEALGRLRREVRRQAPEAVAISLLFSYLDETQERRLAAALGDLGVFTSRSSEVLPVAGEYERGLATWLNAWLGPVVAGYLSRLEDMLPGVGLSVMQSHGGTLGAGQAAARAVNLLLSGPAGGLAAARAVARELGHRRVLTLDMGGTSTDVAMVDGDVRLTREGRIGGWPVAVPMVEMHTIGAGGGSLARVDEAGMLHVGPQSAGADPGPACYGRGGTILTVTDANLLVGRLPASVPLAGSLGLDPVAARRAAERLAAQMGLSLEEAANGVLHLANEHMAQALRVISVQRGHDPAGFALLAFGGAGGLHACDLAEMLGVRTVILPRNGGVFSAQGLIMAPRRRELVRALPADAGDEALGNLGRELEDAGRAALRAEGVADAEIHAILELDLGYRGQSFQLGVPWRGSLEVARADFQDMHEVRYGHRLSLPVEVVNVRARVSAGSRAAPAVELPATDAAPVDRVRVAGVDGTVPLFVRETLARGQRTAGPAILAEGVGTAWVAPGWELAVHESGHVILTRDRKGTLPGTGSP